MGADCQTLSAKWFAPPPGIGVLALAFVFAFAFALTPPLAAQIFPKVQQTIFWRGDRVVVQEWGQSELAVDSKRRKEELSISLPHYLDPKSLDVYDGHYWASIKREKPDGGRIVDLLWSPTGREWFLAGILDAPKESVPSRLLPLDTGLVLIVSNRGMRMGGKESFLALGRIKEDQHIVVERLLDPGFKKPLFVKTAKGLWTVNEPYLALSAGFGSEVVRSDDAVALAHDKLGWIWLVETRNPNPELRLVRLYEAIDESHLSRPYGKGLDVGILGIQPRKNGHFLIAARTQAAVLHGRDFEQDQEPVSNPKAIPTPSQVQRAATGQQKAVSDYPELEWWDLDPHTGTLTREPVPAGAPSRFRSPADIMNFRFRFDARERVIIGG